MRQRRFGWLVAVVAVLACAPESAAQAPPGAVVDVVSPSLAPCTTGMRVVGFDHGPDGLPVVAWTEDCASDGATAAFWTRGASGGGGWNPRPFQSDRRFDHDHRLFVMPGDGAPMLLFSSIGNFLEELEGSRFLTRVESVQVFRMERELRLCRARITVSSFSWREP